MENIAMIDKHNAAGASWTMGVNGFADLTAKEFSAVARYTHTHTHVDRAEMESCYFAS